MNTKTNKNTIWTEIMDKVSVQLVAGSYTERNSNSNGNIDINTETVDVFPRTPLPEQNLALRQKMAIISLFKAVAAQAIDDYRALSNAKLVFRDKIRKPWKQTKVAGGDYVDEPSARSLLLWLGGKGLEECLDASHEKIHPDFIRRHIGFSG